MNMSGGEFVARHAVIDARDLIVEAIEAFPDDRTKQFAHFQKALDERSQYQRSVHWYYFVNLASYILDTRRAKNKTRTAAQVAEDEEAIESIKSKIMLLALLMPNGKIMSDCTGEEMISFGGAYKRIGLRVGKRTVGKALSEDQIRKLMIEPPKAKAA